MAFAILMGRMQRMEPPMKLPNYLAGQWIAGSGPGTSLVDPVTGDELARISSDGVDLKAALEFARSQGGPALRELTYTQRADLLARIGELLTANRDEYFRLSLLNLGATQADASFDVDGALYTIKYYAKIGRALAEGKMLKEGAPVSLSKTGVFAGQHFLVPTKGVGVFINAFNFPAWGFCEKAAPALLSGVPVLVKPASPTAWLTHKMAEDVVKSGLLPPGAVSLVCGSARELLDHVCEEDIVSFTGSADTAAHIPFEHSASFSAREYRGRQHQLRHSGTGLRAWWRSLRSSRKRSLERNNPQGRPEMHDRPACLRSAPSAESVWRSRFVATQHDGSGKSSQFGSEGRTCGQQSAAKSLPRRPQEVAIRVFSGIWRK